jgi:hypothetical protein
MNQPRRARAVDAINLFTTSSEDIKSHPFHIIYLINTIFKFSYTSLTCCVSYLFAIVSYFQSSHKRHSKKSFVDRQKSLVDE